MADVLPFPAHELSWSRLDEVVAAMPDFDREEVIQVMKLVLGEPGDDVVSR